MRRVCEALAECTRIINSNEYVIHDAPCSPDCVVAPVVSKLPTEDEIKRAVFEAIDDCSTTDFYDIAPSGLDNLAMLAAKAVINLLPSGQPTEGSHQ